MQSALAFLIVPLRIGVSCGLAGLLSNHSPSGILLRGAANDAAWRPMHFLLTNDDGIHADGLSALARAVLLLPDSTITIVAPATEQSQCGHRVTTHADLEVERCDSNRFAVSGTPADCVRVALFGLGIRPDFVLSGINHGGNMGQDLVISGTVAAAREAAYHGIRAAAFSHYLIKDIALDWSRMADWTAQMLKATSEEVTSKGEFWNINFPHLPPGPRGLPESVRCEPARSPLGVSYMNNGDDLQWPKRFRYSASYASRPRDPGSDVEACFSGKIAVTRLRV